MKLNLMNNAKTKFFRALENIGNFLNQIPEGEKKVKVKDSSPDQRSGKKKTKKTRPKSDKSKVSKGAYGHKGSSYHGKGGLTTDTATFNHPRKSVPEGMGRK